jgi:hypothetical protein
VNRRFGATGDDHVGQAVAQVLDGVDDRLGVLEAHALATDRVVRLDAGAVQAQRLPRDGVAPRQHRP